MSSIKYCVLNVNCSGTAQLPPSVPLFAWKELSQRARIALSEAPLRLDSNGEIRIKIGPETTEIPAKEVLLQMDLPTHGLAH